MSKDPPCRLYLITPPAIDNDDAFADALAAALDAGDVGAVQIRLKGCGEDRIRRAAEAVLPICRARDIAVIMNDSAVLADACDCDGVHLGEDDGSFTEARTILGDERIIGVSCYDSIDRAFRLAEGSHKKERGADYVAFGAIYSTATKTPKALCPLDVIESWTLATTVPSVAIGGITADNAAPVIEAGADFLAVIASVWDHPDGPAAGVAALDAVLGRYR
jgi:thiamine-phosphate pyrophosphorylase